ncbi:hypothetical protein MGYG_00163 [Nannizzia gypsea CBS 118893]|uniref:Uncharacterized protein n=1 Tax=Arthroderma gypseum (strain ATCC MYA-4604 / CBS 118893) TaxID=535722 RepID=E5R391_ARTGP|nr:hypothetical protein MGYG_00163 [Nannizzia gypsea CBS 118893]EFQ97120.1 hypothetical protein MGYG_00163 [Nannizzia gypsea CBS 118893]
MSNPLRNGGVKNEAAGPVASDSLAAESVREHGKFGENKGSQPLGVQGSHSTFANTDTSSASKLQAAPDAEARLAEAEWGEGQPQKRSQTQTQGQEQAKSHGDEQQQGQSYNKTSGTSSGTTGSGQDGGSGTSVNTAPHYVDPVLGSMQGSKPKGKNLTEGGFEDDASQNVSFNAEIGSRNDPGLQAEREIGNMNAQNIPGPTSKGGPDLMGGSERKVNASYNVLGSEEDA